MAIQVTIKSDVPSFLKKISTMVKNNNGSFSGNEKSGNVSVSLPIGTISGVYVIQNNVCQVTINKKPFLLPMHLVESTIRKELE